MSELLGIVSSAAAIKATAVSFDSMQAFRRSYHISYDPLVLVSIQIYNIIKKYFTYPKILLAISKVHVLIKVSRKKGFF